MPLIKKMRIWSDRRKLVEVPLFNGYIFVKPSNTQRDLVLQTTGVVKYLKHNGADASVSDDEIKKIKVLIEKGYDLSEYNDADVFFVGDEVQVSSGPMRGYSGEIVRISDEYYALMYLIKMGQSIKIKLPLQVLKRVEK